MKEIKTASYIEMKKKSFYFYDPEGKVPHSDPSDSLDSSSQIPEDIKGIDRMSLAQVLYWYCAEHHSGQWSDEYSVLSTLGYNPGMTERGIDENDYEQQQVYDRLASGEINPVALKDFILGQYENTPEI